MNKFLLVLGVIITLLLPTQLIAENNTNQSFSKAKRILLKEVYYDHLTTFYCNCTFSKEKEITEKNGYSPKKRWTRSNRIEWEHVVPAHAFGWSFTEWREGHRECVNRKGKKFKGRRCAEKMNVKFRYMQSDMYNLVPAVGEINALRSNYSFTMIPGESRQSGSCDMEIENKKAEPPPNVRGNIARIYMYMNSTYPGHGIISNKNKKLFEAWDKLDPVDEWECKRAQRIEAIQRNENHIIKNRCKAVQFWTP